MNKTITLRKKLLTWLLLPMLILLMVSATVMYYLAFRFVNYAYDYALLDSTHDISGLIVTVGGRASLNLSESDRKMITSDEFDTIYFNVIDKDGTVIAGDPDLPPPHALKSSDSTIRDDELRYQKLRIASISFLPPGLPADQAVVVQVAETLNKRNTLANRVITAMILPQILLIVIAAVIVWVGIKKGLSPLNQLHREIAARSHIDLSPVKESDTPEEVRPIIHEINELMRRLGSTLETQQQFIADAAHQLRTPLSGLKTQVSLALRQTDPTSLRHSLDQMNASTDRTIRLINQMLVLAQVERGSETITELKLFDLGKLVRETTREWVPSALKKNIDLGYEGLGNSVMIRGDMMRIKMMIDNLIDNAIKYSPGMSNITARLECVAGTVILTVEDNGIGIPDGEKNAVFQRFYRIINNTVSGSGLGLSIVHEIAVAHGARVSIEDPEDHRGTSVKVIFPYHRQLL